VKRISVFGVRLTSDPEGYRLLLNYPAVYRLVRKIRPHVVEAGDPWLTNLFCLFTPFPAGTIRSAFYHSDPVDTYLRPWASGSLGRWLTDRFAALFYRLQRRYDAVLVSSETMEAKLEAKKVPRTVLVPLGVDPVFFEERATPEPSEAEKESGAVRLLYLGRLDREKGVDLLLKGIPRLLEDPRIQITVGGRGQYSGDFRRVDHPRYRFLGYIESDREVAELYRRHQVFLAPGPHETFGLAPLEAMASGLVVVGPDRGGTGEMLRGLPSAFLFQAGDADRFCDAVFAAAGSDLSAEGRRAREYARSYGTWDAAIGRMTDHYRHMVKERGKA
jgi:alpha-1,6-mannosyltransferase